MRRPLWTLNDLSRRSLPGTLLRTPEGLVALLGLALVAAAWGVARIKGLSGCPLCLAQRAGLGGVSLGLLLSLRFPVAGYLCALGAAGVMMDRAWMQLVLEHGVRLEQFAYVWSLYQKAGVEGQHQLLPVLQPFYDLTWPFAKLPFWGLLTGWAAALFAGFRLGGCVIRGIRKKPRDARSKVANPGGHSGLAYDASHCPPRKPPGATVFFFWALSFGLTAGVDAKDFGTMGAVFPVVEESLATVLARRAGDADLPDFQRRWKETTASWTPAPVTGLTRTQTPRTFRFDPTFTVEESLKDHQGTVFAPKGMTVNPLRIMPFTGTLVFLDGTSRIQKAWVRHKAEPGTKVVLVSGDPRALMEETGRTLYFDQGGFLSRRLGLTQVPARVVQDGDSLRVEELREEDL